VRSSRTPAGQTYWCPTAASTLPQAYDFPFQTCSMLTRLPPKNMRITTFLGAVTARRIIWESFVHMQVTVAAFSTCSNNMNSQPTWYLGPPPSCLHVPTYQCPLTMADDVVSEQSPALYSTLTQLRPKEISGSRLFWQRQRRVELHRCPPGLDCGNI
jgi:hypothetical protein